jgi:hypothetical protein
VNEERTGSPATDNVEQPARSKKLDKKDVEKAQAKVEEKSEKDEKSKKQKNSKKEDTEETKDEESQSRYIFSKELSTSLEEKQGYDPNDPNSPHNPPLEEHDELRSQDNEEAGTGVSAYVPDFVSSFIQPITHKVGGLIWNEEITVDREFSDGAATSPSEKVELEAEKVENEKGKENRGSEQVTKESSESREPELNNKEELGTTPMSDETKIAIDPPVQEVGESVRSASKEETAATSYVPELISSIIDPISNAVEDLIVNAQNTEDGNEEEDLLSPLPDESQPIKRTRSSKATSMGGLPPLTEDMREELRYGIKVGNPPLESLKEEPQEQGSKENFDPNCSKPKAEDKAKANRKQKKQKDYQEDDIIDETTFKISHATLMLP